VKLSQLAYLVGCLAIWHVTGYALRSLSRRAGGVEFDAEAIRTAAANANYSGVLRQALRTRRIRFKAWGKFLGENPDLRNASHMRN